MKFVDTHMICLLDNAVNYLFIYCVIVFRRAMKSDCGKSIFVIQATVQAGS